MLLFPSLTSHWSYRRQQAHFIDESTENSYHRWKWRLTKTGKTGLNVGVGRYKPLLVTNFSGSNPAPARDDAYKKDANAIVATALQYTV